MPGPPVTIGCNVVLTPGMTPAPDTGVIVMVPPGGPSVGGMPLAMTGSICLMTNSVTGAPYPMPIGPLAPSGVRISGRPLVRLGDAIPSGPGVLTIVGPPAAPFVVDRTA